MESSISQTSLLFACVCLLHLSLADNPFIWHTTDFHIDPSYSVNRLSCEESVREPGEYGDPLCDAPYKLVEASVKALREKGNHPKFIIYSGDTLPHVKDYSGFSSQYIISFLQNLTDTFKKYFPVTPVVMGIGNHDYYPKGQLPGTTNDVYRAAAEMWKDWLVNDDAMDTFRKGAYYTRLLVPDENLRIVVTNTNLYLTGNKATEGVTDPGGQFAWLRDVLSTSRTNGERVHLVAHVPPGKKPVQGGPSWLRSHQNKIFNNIIRHYGDVIVGFYSAHEHIDTFRLYYKNGEPVAVMLLGPAVTPLVFQNSSLRRNPGVRKIYLDDKHGHLTNIEQFYLDLPTANRLDEAKWEKLYSFKEAYKLNNVTARSLHGLVDKFNQTDSGEFDRYYNSFHVRVNNPRPCDCDCKRLHLCSLVYVDYDDFDGCYTAVACGASSCFIHTYHIIAHIVIVLALKFPY